MSNPSRASKQLLEAASNDLDAVFDSLAEVGATVREVQSAAGKAGSELRGADLAALRPMLRERLRRHDSLLAGIGVLARPGLLGDAPLFVEWWCAGPTEPFPLRVSLDPDHAIFSDYDTFEWFEGPWAAGSKRIVGPWVDYTGTGDHVLTLSVPIFGAPDEFLGVVGADVLARRVEEFALGRLRMLPEGAALVNAEGRVLASNTSRLLVGTIVNFGDEIAEIEHPELPWRVVVFSFRRSEPAVGHGA